MQMRHIYSTLTAASVLLLTGSSLRANAVSALQDFNAQMGTYNVITSGNFSTNNHVHGKLAVGGSAKFYGSAEVNSHNHSGEALRTYGNLVIEGTASKVLSGGATILKNGSVNSGVYLHNAGAQAVINYSSNINTGPKLTFNGNGGAPILSSIATADTFFSSRDTVMQAANTEFLGISPTATSVRSGNRLTISGTGSDVSVFNWNIDQVTGIGEVGFNFNTSSFIVINIIGNTFNSIWNASFNILNGTDTLASKLLWNIGVGTANLTGDQLLGSILAPDSTINSYKQLNGSLYSKNLKQYDREIHYTPPVRVPDEPSLAILALALLALGLPGVARHYRRMSAR